MILFNFARYANGVAGPRMNSCPKKCARSPNCHPRDLVSAGKFSESLPSSRKRFASQIWTKLLQ